MGRARDRGRPRGNDPLHATPNYVAARRHLRNISAPRNAPCARCGGRIDYDAPAGHPRALIAGHKVSVIDGIRLGWTEAQINALANFQPECTRCSTASGARALNALRRQRERQAEAGGPTRAPLRTTEPW